MINGSNGWLAGRRDGQPRQGTGPLDGGPASTKCQLVPSFHIECDATPLLRMINTLVKAVRPLHRGQMQPPGPACPRSLAGWGEAGHSGTALGQERTRGMEEREVMSCMCLQEPVGASWYGVEAMRQSAAPVVA